MIKASDFEGPCNEKTMFRLAGILMYTLIVSFSSALVAWGFDASGAVIWRVTVSSFAIGLLRLAHFFVADKEVPQKPVRLTPSMGDRELNALADLMGTAKKGASTLRKFGAPRAAEELEMVLIALEVATKEAKGE
jgi:hypothetical protein